MMVLITVSVVMKIVVFKTLCLMMVMVVFKTISILNVIVVSISGEMLYLYHSCRVLAPCCC